MEEVNSPISEEVSSALERLSGLELINRINRAHFALTILGIKSACGFGFGEGKDRKRDEFLKTKQIVEEILADLGLPHSSQSMVDDEEGEGINFDVGKDQESYEALKRYDQSSERKIESPEHHVAFGKLMGYPETATKAWQENNWDTYNTLIDPKNPPAELAETDGYKCGFFSFSKAHWREELSQAQEWAEALKKMHHSCITS